MPSKLVRPQLTIQVMAAIMVMIYTLFLRVLTKKLTSVPLGACATVSASLVLRG
jgi:hypothetical protein